MSMSIRHNVNGSAPLSKWVRDQLGPGKRFPSKRSLNRAMGLSEHVATYLIDRGYGNMDTLVRLADACDVDPLYVLGMAIGREPGQLMGGTSPEEGQLLGYYRQATPALRQVILGAARGAAGAVPDEAPREMVGQV